MKWILLTFTLLVGCVSSSPEDAWKRYGKSCQKSADQGGDNPSIYYNDKNLCCSDKCRLREKENTSKCKSVCNSSR